MPEPWLNTEYEMEVVPQHLVLVQQGMIITQMQHTIVELKRELVGNRNQHLLGMQQAPWCRQWRHHHHHQYLMPTDVTLRDS